MFDKEKPEHETCASFLYKFTASVSLA